MARDLLRRWWGLELGLSEPAGGGYVRKSHAMCETVHGAEPGACAGALTEIAASFAAAKRGEPVIKQCHAGLVLVAAPVFGTTGTTPTLLGVVYATGARAEGSPAD